MHYCIHVAVLPCLVCLFDLACFFLSSFSSLIQNMYMFKSHQMQLIFPLKKLTALDVLCCFALLFVRPCLRLSFFLLHLSLTCTRTLAWPLEREVSASCTLSCTNPATMKASPPSTIPTTIRCSGLREAGQETAIV